MNIVPIELNAGCYEPIKIWSLDFLGRSGAMVPDIAPSVESDKTLDEKPKVVDYDGENVGLRGSSHNNTPDHEQ